jgi:hypothetical protein
MLCADELEYATTASTGSPSKDFCVCPDWLVETPSACVCDTGHVPDGTGNCNPCAAGSAKPTIGSDPCEPCQPGWSAQYPGQATCERTSLSLEPTCPRPAPLRARSFVLNHCVIDSRHLACEPGTFTEKAGAEVCEPCSFGSYSSIGQTGCSTCGLYVKPELTAVTADPFSPNGINCPSGVLNGTLSGHWSEYHLTTDNANVTRTWACASPDELKPGKRARCLGGMNSSCADGHDSGYPLCARCLPGYYLYADMYCYEAAAPKNWTLAISTAGFLLLFGFAGSCVFMSCCMFASKGEKDTLEPPWVLSDAAGGAKRRVQPCAMTGTKTEDSNARVCEWHAWVHSPPDACSSELDPELIADSLRQLGLKVAVEPVDTTVVEATEQAAAACVSIFLVSPHFFVDKRSLSLLQQAIQSEHPVVMLSAPSFRFRAKPPTQAGLKSVGGVASMLMKLNKMKVASKNPAISFFFKRLKQKGTKKLKQLIPAPVRKVFFKIAGQEANLNKPFKIPENAWNKAWRPFTPEVRSAFNDPIIWYVADLHNSSMATLLRRVSSLLKRSLGSSGIDFVSATTAIAKWEERGLKQKAELAALSDECRQDEQAGGAAQHDDAGLKYDAYISYKMSDLSQGDVECIYEPLSKLGMRLCTERFTSKLKRVDQIADYVGASRRFVLLLTTNVFDSYWVWQEVHSALQRGCEFVFVMMEDAEWKDTSGRLTRPTPDMAKTALLRHCTNVPTVAVEAVLHLFGAGFEVRLVKYTPAYAASFERAVARLCGTPLSVQEQLAAHSLDPRSVEAAELLLDIAEINRAAPSGKSSELRVSVTTPGDVSSMKIMEIVPTDGRVIRWMNRETFKEYLHSSRAAQLVLYGEDREGFSHGQPKPKGEDIGATSSYLVRLAAPRLQAELGALGSGTGDPSGALGSAAIVLDNDFDLSAVSFAGLSADDLNLDTSLFDDLNAGLNDVYATLKKQAKPFLAFFQINASFQKSFTVKWPSAVTDLFSIFGVLDFNFLWDEVDKFNAQMAGILNYANQTILFMAMFAVCFAGAVVAITLIPCTFLRFDKGRREQFVDNTHFVLLLITFTCYPILSSRLLRLYKLQTYGDYSVLSADLSLSWDDPNADIDLSTYWIMGLPFVFLYVLGIPVAFWYILSITAKPKPPPSAKASKKKDAKPKKKRASIADYLQNDPLLAKKDAEKLHARRVQRYSFLSDIYEPRCWWWELTELARKLCMTSMVIFVPPPGSTTQIAISGLIAIAFFTMSATYMPFKSFRLDIVNFNAQLNTMFTLLIMFALRTDITTDGVISVDFLNMLMLLAQMSVGIAAFLLSLWILYHKLAMRRRVVNMRKTAGGALTDTPPVDPLKKAGGGGGWLGDCCGLNKRKNALPESTNWGDTPKVSRLFTAEAPALVFYESRPRRKRADVRRKSDSFLQDPTKSTVTAPSQLPKPQGLSAKLRQAAAKGDVAAAGVELEAVDNKVRAACERCSACDEARSMAMGSHRATLEDAGKGQKKGMFAMRV